MSNLEEKRIQTEKVYSGSFLDVRKDTVKLPNGESSTREWIKHPGAVCIIPVLKENSILFIRQYRYPIRKHMIEIPAGKLDAGEDPLTCGLRELEEETGYVAEKLTLLTTIYPAIGFTDEKMWIYIAENLTKTKPKLDKDEFLEPYPLPLDKALKMVWESKINDAKTMVALLMFSQLKNFNL